MIDKVYTLHSANWNFFREINAKEVWGQIAERVKAPQVQKVKNYIYQNRLAILTGTLGTVGALLLARHVYRQAANLQEQVEKLQGAYSRLEQEHSDLLQQKTFLENEFAKLNSTYAHFLKENVRVEKENVLMSAEIAQLSQAVFVQAKNKLSELAQFKSVEKRIAPSLAATINLNEDQILELVNGCTQKAKDMGQIILAKQTDFTQAEAECIHREFEPISSHINTLHMLYNKRARTDWNSEKSICNEWPPVAEILNRCTVNLKF